jgi:uncharacterized protein YcfL
MKLLKNVLTVITLSLLISSCGSYPTKSKTKIKEDPVVIANEKLAYEIIIIDQGFTTFLNTQARTRDYYSNTYLRNKNKRYVQVWNSRARNPQRYNPSIYENVINFDPTVDYGLEVNYKLYWYFKFAEQKYRMRLDN